MLRSPSSSRFRALACALSTRLAEVAPTVIPKSGPFVLNPLHEINDLEFELIRRTRFGSFVDFLIFNKIISMVAREGIEPPTRGFSVRCSTN